MKTKDLVKQKCIAGLFKVLDEQFSQFQSKEQFLYLVAEYIYIKECRIFDLEKKLESCLPFW